MDLSQYAELFLAESREHLSACNQLLREWEKLPSGLAPVGGLFRAVHTVKGMAATMGYARVTDLAHRMESLLDLLRRGARPATDELLQLLFRARDALEHAVELSVVGRERELEVAEVVADLDHAASRMAAPRPQGPGGRATPPPPASPPPVRSEEHTSELQSRLHLVCRLLLEKKKKPDRPSSALQFLPAVNKHPARRFGMARDIVVSYD